MGGNVSKPRKMVNLAIEETSGVDHPAHLHEGWLVMKSADAQTVTTLLDTLTQSNTREDKLSDTKSTDERLTEALEALAKAEEKIAELEGENAPESAEEAPAADEAPAEATEEAAPADAEEAPAGDDDIMKSAPESVIKMVESIKAEKESAVLKAQAAEEALRKERDERADADAVAKARTTYGALAIDAEKVGPALRRLAQIDSALAKSLEEALTVANGQMESANIFAEIGKAKSGTAGTAWEQIEAVAKAAVEAGKAPTMEIAMAEALNANPALYNEYLNEKGA